MRPDGLQPLECQTPETSPFEVIKGLDLKIKKQLRKNDDCKRMDETPLADYMITSKQYDSLYQQIDFEDAHFYLKKFKWDKFKVSIKIICKI